MYLQNVTFNIDTQAEVEFLSWMKTQHIPEIMATGLPTNFKILKLLTEVHNGGSTYSFQYAFETKQHYDIYEAIHFDGLIAKVDARYKGKYVFFASLLQEMDV
ncbi:MULTISPECIES: DUF4286 family protein [Flectobacillus]|uniref:DUF4286 family protein n=1 Tax=Flectobacillus roseus TaxID=502259 RepID=A0ABT6Y5S3_9BACT|nr:MULTISPECIES: DUF4286 family protein [Flectobacillus]MDI9858910.1 DUF4286 family protein [Flectobacillus roseus]PAC28008.1 hypothetical protein BWI92_20815 [Flectobacillus sp. BAB-3569]